MIDVLVAAADLKALDRSALESLVAAQQLQLSAKSEALAAEQEKRISRDSEIEHLEAGHHQVAEDDLWHQE